MQRFKNILVGVDLFGAKRLDSSGLSAPTTEAIRQAMWLAEQTRAELTFFSAVEISQPAKELLDQNENSDPDSVRTAAEEILSGFVAEAQKLGIVASTVIAFGKEWLEVIRQVLRGQHDLVIVGTRQRSTAQRLLFGSTAIKLLRKCPCPVWVTKPVTRPDDDSELNILVAGDLGDVSADALDLAVSGAQLLDAKLHLIHAIERPLARTTWLTRIGEKEIAKYCENARAACEQTLHEQLAATDYRTLTHGVQLHIVEGPADVVILNAIEEFDVDLLAMGTVARTGIPGVLIGNTAERLLPQIPCSLLAIKPADFESPVKVETD